MHFRENRTTIIQIPTVHKDRYQVNILKLWANSNVLSISIDQSF